VLGLVLVDQSEVTVALSALHLITLCTEREMLLLEVEGLREEALSAKALAEQPQKLQSTHGVVSPNLPQPLPKADLRLLIVRSLHLLLSTSDCALNVHLIKDQSKG